MSSDLSPIFTVAKENQRYAPGKTIHVAPNSRSRVVRRLLIAIVLTSSVAGCVSIEEVNSSFARIDRAWQLEYQRTEDEFRYRVVEADYETTLRAVRQTYLDLGMPIQVQSGSRGVIVAENAAPTPLTLEEWKEVVRIEGPRAKEIGGWYMEMRDDPKGYFVAVKATLRPMPSGTFVILDYELDNREIRAMGVRPSKHAPPRAVQLGSLKFWAQLEKRLSEVRAPAPRKRESKEIEI